MTEIKAEPLTKENVVSQNPNTNIGHPTGITLPSHYANQDMFAGHKLNCFNNLTTGILEMDRQLDQMRFNFLTALDVEPMPILPAGVWESLCREDQKHLKNISAQKRALAHLVQIAMFIGMNSDKAPVGVQDEPEN